MEQLGSEKAALQREKSELQRQVGSLAGSVDRLAREKVEIESQVGRKGGLWVGGWGSEGGILYGVCVRTCACTCVW